MKYFVDVEYTDTDKLQDTIEVEVESVTEIDLAFVADKLDVPTTDIADFQIRNG
jgi:hypothetical protein